MRRQKLVRTYLFSWSWLCLWFTVILLGIFFCFAYLGDKIYWVDEVVTCLHIAGYAQQKITTKLSQQSLISVDNLQKYQQISSEKKFVDALEACKENPEHPPLYFTYQDLFVLNHSASLMNQIKQKKQVYLEQVYQPTLFVPNELYLSIGQI